MPPKANNLIYRGVPSPPPPPTRDMCLREAKCQVPEGKAWCQRVEQFQNWDMLVAENKEPPMPYRGVNCLWFAFVCFQIRSHPPPPLFPPAKRPCYPRKPLPTADLSHAGPSHTGLSLGGRGRGGYRTPSTLP